MKTNFFENIKSLGIPGIWKLVIQTDDQGHFTVSELFTAAQRGDGAANAINPMAMNGTAQEMDENFFDFIAAPALKASGLYSTMDAHLKSVEDARLQSKMVQDAKAKLAKDKKDSENAGEEKDGIIVPKISKEERKKLYDEAMRKVNDLSGSLKYADALEALPKTEDYPEKKAELEKKTEDLNRMKKFYDQQYLQFNSEEN